MAIAAAITTIKATRTTAQPQLVNPKPDDGAVIAGGGAAFGAPAGSASCPATVKMLAIHANPHELAALISVHAA